MRLFNNEVKYLVDNDFESIELSIIKFQRYTKSYLK